MSLLLPTNLFASSKHGKLKPIPNSLPVKLDRVRSFTFEAQNFDEDAVLWVLRSFDFCQLKSIYIALADVESGYRAADFWHDRIFLRSVGSDDTLERISIDFREWP